MYRAVFVLYIFVFMWPRCADAAIFENPVTDQEFFNWSRQCVEARGKVFNEPLSRDALNRLHKKQKAGTGRYDVTNQDLGQLSAFYDFRNPDYESSPPANGRVLSGKIQRIFPMECHHSMKQLVPDFANHVYIAFLKKALGVFKPRSEPGPVAAEIGAYRIARAMGLKNLVPPTVLSRFGDQVGCLQYYVETPIDLLNAPLDWKDKLNRDNSAVMNVFLYVMGQWDHHYGNRMLTRSEDSKEMNFVAIDNEGIANESYSQGYGQFPFVCVEKNKDAPFFEEFSFRELDCDDIRDGEKSIVRELRSFFKAGNQEVSEEQITAQIQRRFWGGKKLKYALYKDGFWVQFYSRGNKIPPAYTDYYPSFLIKALKGITRKSLKRAFEVRSVQKAYHRKKRIFDDNFYDCILKRRDEVLQHAEEQVRKE